jgi:hypothetical protein
MNKFTKSHIGASVVYRPSDGGSVSATIVHVTPFLVRLKFAVLYKGIASADLNKEHWGRLTLFPKGAMFFVAE